MNNLSRLLAVAALLALILWPAAFATADDDDDDEDAPSVHTQAATAIGDGAATLTAKVKDNGSETSFRFEYGTTTGYGQSTPDGTLPRDSSTRTVSAVIGGLKANTVYHFRLRASNDEGTTRGEDASFTTTGTVATPTGTDPSQPDSVLAPSIAATKPVLGTSVVVAPLAGTIRVKPPGAARYVSLAAGDSLPVGTIVDTRRGTIKLTSSLGAGTTQSGEFRGALFQVRQAATGHGMTALHLRGENFAACPSRKATGMVVRAAAKRKAPQRRLWSRDKGGSFRTHGRNSVATVRGTAWVTTDTCAGTRTTVTEGAVSVRDRRTGKAVLVRAGRSHLARSAR